MKSLLAGLEHQRTDGLFSYSIVVTDNDRLESGRQAVTEFAAESSLTAIYSVEPEQNIAMARNESVRNAIGDFIAFIDDDELPSENWLLQLFNACEVYKVEGVLGPVKPYFEHEPPQWIIKGKFFDRPTHPSGYKMDWPETRTGNVLFRRHILEEVPVPFNPEFGTGSEDSDFFRRMMEKGCSFAWCNEASVHELVPPSRCTKRYMLRRALLRGSSFRNRPTRRLPNLTKSLLAVPIYTLALPVLALFGQHMFVKYLVKLVDHGSRILSFLGLKLARIREI